MGDELKQLTCEDCNITNENVKETNCPYFEDVYNEKVKAVVCDECYYEREPHV